MHSWISCRPDRLADIRRNRVAIMKDHNLKEYTDLNLLKKKLKIQKNFLKKIIGQLLM